MSSASPPPKWIGEIVKQLRAEAGMSQAALACEAGANVNVIARMEAGTACTIPMLERVLGALGYELEVVKCK
mgnify:CR=1 FL=1